MIKGVEDGEGETGGILGGCTLSGGCVHVLKSTLKAPFRCKAGGLRTTQTRLEDRTRRGVERCGGLASAISGAPGRRERLTISSAPGGVIFLRRKTSPRANKRNLIETFVATAHASGTVVVAFSKAVGYFHSGKIMLAIYTPQVPTR